MPSRLRYAVCVGFDLNNCNALVISYPRYLTGSPRCARDDGLANIVGHYTLMKCLLEKANNQLLSLLGTLSLRGAK